MSAPTYALPLTREAALELLDAAVADRGADYVYINPYGESPSRGGENNVDCYNYDPDTLAPSCIVGHAFHAVLGEEIRRLRAQSSAGQLDSYFATEEARAVLTRAQVVQDHGGTWGEAVVAARRGEMPADMQDLLADVLAEYIL